MKTESSYDALLHAIPMPVFIVDAGVRIKELNIAASHLSSTERDNVLNNKAGDILHCIHSFDTIKGCGHSPACKDCIIRNSVTECCNGSTVTRKKAQSTFKDGNLVTKIDYLITVSPLPKKNGLHFLLIIEDITEFLLLKDLIPICSHCRKLRDDDKYWQSLEEYFHKYSEIQFSHGICGTCLETLYPDYIEK